MKIYESVEVNELLMSIKKYPISLDEANMMRATLKESIDKAAFMQSVSSMNKLHSQQIEDNNSCTMFYETLKNSGKIGCGSNVMDFIKEHFNIDYYSKLLSTSSCNYSH